MTPSKVLFYLCIAFIIGIFLESLFKIPQFLIWGILIIGILFALCCFLENKPTMDKKFTMVNFLPIVGFCMLFVVMGILRVQISQFNIASDKLSKFNDAGKVTFTGVVSDEPDVRDTVQMIEVKSENSTVLVTTKIYPEIKYLDAVKITGKLETPSVTDTFNYKNYLLKDHIYSVMGFPKIEILPEKVQYDIFSFLYEKVLYFKQKLRESIQRNFLPPQSSILEGTILGDNGAMSSDLKSKLNVTGLRHIISVSGTHVIILSAIVMSLLLSMGLRRGQAFYVAILLVIIYIVLTGLPSSGVRAGVMGGAYLLSQKIGRQTMGPRLIASACAVMLLINPLLLVYDIGFQLSFLAVLGLIYLDPLFRIIFKKISFGKAKNLAGVVSATFAAQIFTLPVMIYNFGNISFVSPLTNLLVSPIVYWLMVLGFIVSIAGIFSNVLGFILSIPCWFLLKYFLWIIDFFSQPWAMKTFQNIHWVWLIILYLIIIIFTRFLNKKYRKEFL